MNWGLVLASTTALGAGALAAWGAGLIRNLIGRVLQRQRFRSPLRRMEALQLRREALGEDALYGLDRVPWNLWRVAGAAVGVALAYLLLVERSPALAVVGLAGVFAPRLIRAYLVRRRSAQIERQVRDLVFLLRPALGMHGGLRPALEEVQRRLSPGIARDRLDYHLQRAFLGSPEDVIEALAADLHSQEMERLLLGIRAAQQGGMTFAEAVLMAAEEAQERIYEDARVAIEETPIRLLIPILFLLLPPILILSMYPLVARLLSMMTTPATGGIGW